MNHIVEASLGITLMRFDPYLEAHVQSGERKYSYYFQVPDDWAALDPADLRSWVLPVANAIYREHGARLREAEPNDLSYLAVISAEARLLSEQESQPRPWLSSPTPVWESSCCAVVKADGAHQKVPADAFPSA